MRKIEIALHLGIHKTATTYLQDNLSSIGNQEVLKEENIQFLGPQTLRPSKFTQLVRRAQLDHEDPLLASLETITSDFLIDENISRFIFSDENLMGSCAEAFRQPADFIYPHLDSKLKLLKHLF